MSKSAQRQRLLYGVMLLLVCEVPVLGQAIAQADEIPFTPTLQEVYPEPPIDGDSLPVLGVLADRSLEPGPDPLNVVLMLPARASQHLEGGKACVLARSRDARLVIRGELNLPTNLAGRGRSLQIKGDWSEKVRGYLASARAEDLSLRVVLGACKRLLGKGELPTLLAVDPAPRSSPPATGLRLLLNVASPQVRWRYVPMGGMPNPWTDCLPGALPGNAAFNVVCRLPMPAGETARLDIARVRDYQDPEVTSVRVLVGGR